MSLFLAQSSLSQKDAANMELFWRLENILIAIPVTESIKKKNRDG